MCYKLAVHFYVYSIEYCLYLTTLCDKYRAITTAKYLLSSVFQAYEKRISCLNSYILMTGNKNSHVHHAYQYKPSLLLVFVSSVSHQWSNLLFHVIDRIIRSNCYVFKIKFSNTIWHILVLKFSFVCLGVNTTPSTHPR